MTAVPTGLTRLPAGARFAARTALGLSLIVSFFAFIDMGQLGRPTERDLDASVSRVNESLRESAREGLMAHFKALDSMRDARTVTLGALSVATVFTFMAALRFLRPGPFPRGLSRRMLVIGTLLCSLLRAADGAELAVAWKRAGHAFYDDLDARLADGGLAADAGPEGFLVIAPPDAGTGEPLLLPPRGAGTGLFVAAQLLQLLFVSGVFSALYVYFSSERLKEQVRALDAARSP